MGAVLITGGAGFVGLNLAEALLRRGEEVVLYGHESALPAGAADAFAALPGRLRLVQGDVRDASALRGALAGVDRLFPFAAITAGPVREAAEPETLMEVNVQGVIATLRAARDAGAVRRVVLPSSAAVYGESFYRFAEMDEADTPAAPLGLYGVTKFAVERAGLRLCALWGLDAVAARIGGTFGPWERDTGLRDTLSPHLAIARAAARRGQAVLPPAPLPSYDWIYVRDLAEGLLRLLDSPEPPHRVVNLASATDWGPHLGACCDVLAAAFPGFRWRHAAPGETPDVPFTETRPRGVMRRGRAAAFGWAPRFAPEAAYRDYAAWMAAHPLAIGA